MFAAIYELGFSLMERPGGIGVGAILVRLAREVDPDEDRQLRAWDTARAILDRWNDQENQR